jgi:NAD(P)-dependent dehydrogenase (short-subunit alcohol dehydrogenase family)
VSELDGKIVFITGGASGIGEATAEVFAEQGATVVVADIDDAKGQPLVKRLGERHR